MDEYSRRSAINDLRSEQDERGNDEAWGISVLDAYDELEQVAQKVAGVVWSIRWPRAYEPSFEIHFGEVYRHAPRMIGVGFYAHQSNDSFEFPFAYLWMTYDQIVTAEDVLKDEAAAAAAEKLRAAQEESRRRDIDTLKRLQERYPEVGYRRDA